MLKQTYDKYKFHDVVKKKYEALVEYSLQNQLVKEGLTFKWSDVIYAIKRSDDSQYLTETLQWKRGKFDFRAYYRSINAYFLATGNIIYKSNSRWLNNHNNLLKRNPNPTAGQKIKLYNKFFKLKKKREKELLS